MQFQDTYFFDEISGSHGEEYKDDCQLVAPYSLVEVYRCFRVRVIAVMMETARASETLENFYHTTRRYNPEDRNLR
jgi:hypothetical protein